MSDMASSMAPRSSYERPTLRSDLNTHRNKTLSEEKGTQQEPRASGLHSRGVARSPHDEDSDDSSASPTSQGGRRRRVKQSNPKTTRTAKTRSQLAPASTPSSRVANPLPTLGRIFEGLPGREPSARSSASILRDRSKPRPHHKHNSTRSGRIARHHLGTQAELQNKLRTLGSPSLQSVISSLTAATSSSSGSNGSTSTVTQSSYTKVESPKRSMMFPQAGNKASQNTHRRRRQRRNSSGDQPNVFAFMENELSRAPRSTASASDSESSEDGPSQPQTPALHAHRSSANSFVSPKPRQPIRVASWQSQDQLHSDSGISVRGSSPESVGRRNSIKQSGADQASEDTKAKTDDDTAAAQEHIKAAASWQRRWSSTSMSAQHSPTYLHSQTSSNHSAAIIPLAAPPPAYPGQTAWPDGVTLVANEQQKLSGYDLLASQLSQPQRDGQIGVPGLYRRFSRLNHRILLHLQDEIAEMEEQLQYLDQSIARLKQSPGSPESRRAEVRYGTELTYQRTDLLGRIFMKTEQYNKAMSSYTTATANSEPACQDDIDRYRAFTNKLRPVVPEELCFLEHCDDLVKPFPRRSQNATPVADPTSRHVTAMPSFILGPPAAMLVAFVMFSAAAGALVRTFLFVLFTGAGVGAMHYGRWGQSVMAEQERQMCLGFYVCLLACIAATAG